MNSANAAQTVSPFPTPPEFAQLYAKPSNETAGIKEPLPPPVQSEFTVFGEEYRLDDEIIRNFFKQCLERIRKPWIYLMILQTATVSLLTLLAPLSIRFSLLAAPIHQEVLLDLVHPPCELDFRSCPFPSARLDAHDLLFPENHYQLSVKMYFSEEEIASRVGIFSNEIGIFDESGVTLGRWKRAGLSKNRNLLSRLLQTVISFYLPEKSFVHQLLESQNSLEMTVVKDFHYNLQRKPAEIVYTLQDHFIHFDEIYLVIQAEAGLLAHFFQYWPIASFCLTCGCIMAVGFSCLTIFWLYKALCHFYSPAAPEEELDGSEEETD